MGLTQQAISTACPPTLYFLSLLHFKQFRILSAHKTLGLSWTQANCLGKRSDIHSTAHKQTRTSLIPWMTETKIKLSDQFRTNRGDREFVTRPEDGLSHVWCQVTLLNPSSQMERQYLTVGHYHFPPHISQLIIKKRTSERSTGTFQQGDAPPPSPPVQNCLSLSLRLTLLP